MWGGGGGIVSRSQTLSSAVLRNRRKVGYNYTRDWGDEMVETKLAEKDWFRNSTCNGYPSRVCKLYSVVFPVVPARSPEPSELCGPVVVSLHLLLNQPAGGRRSS